MDNLIRLLIVDDHEVVLRGLNSLLTAKYGVEVIGEASDGFSAVEMAGKLQPDVILMDMVMPLKSGLEAIKEIKEAQPDIKIVVLSSFSEDTQILAAVRAGAAGYVMKDASPDELVHTIHSAHLGNLTLSEDMFRLVMSQTDSKSTKPKLDASLTEREVDVLRELARGGSNQEIATALSVSSATVRTHINNIFNKLNLQNRTQAALYAIDVGLLEHE